MTVRGIRSTEGQTNMTDDAKATDAKDTTATVDTKVPDTTATNAAPKDIEADKTDDASGLKAALASERAARQRAEKAEKQLRDAELAKLPELDRLKTSTETLTKENDKLTKENTRLKLALEMDLPWSLARRIDGDDEAEMRADAAALLKDFKGKESTDPKDKKRPANDAGKSSTSTSGGLTMNQLMRAAAGK